jgi:hypothetical protein
MSTSIYHTSRWRGLPRTGPCAAAELLGGECFGPIHRHHVHPVSLGGDPDGETIMVCKRHHPMLEALARKIHGLPEWKRCPHTHRSAAAREACEARLNRLNAA